MSLKPGSVRGWGGDREVSLKPGSVRGVGWG